jgi:hypothetical protein
MDETLALFRPVGFKELRKIASAGWKSFPPRLPGQDWFYPVLNAAYAERIITAWNVKDEAADYAGFVLAFQVDAAYASKFEVRTVGSKNQHQELWVPAHELDNFNRHIVGPIGIVKAFLGPSFNWDLLLKGPICTACGNPATCFGTEDDEPAYCCDDCCGHGNEAGWCRPVGEEFAELVKLYQRNLELDDEVDDLTKKVERQADRIVFLYLEALEGAVSHELEQTPYIEELSRALKDRRESLWDETRKLLIGLIYDALRWTEEPLTDDQVDTLSGAVKGSLQDGVHASSLETLQDILTEAGFETVPVLS